MFGLARQECQPRRRSSPLIRGTIYKGRDLAKEPLRSAVDLYSSWPDRQQPLGPMSSLKSPWISIHVWLGVKIAVCARDDAVRSVVPVSPF